MNNIDNPFTRTLSDIGDLIILNVLFIVCCVPVITVGASIAASYKVAVLLADRSCSSVMSYCCLKESSSAWSSKSAKPRY